MRILLILSAVLLGSILLMFLLGALSGRILGSANASDCRPHIYLSGTVEIRGRPGVLYVVDYRDLQELGRMLQVVEADMNGQAKWIGTD